jgi:transposase
MTHYIGIDVSRDTLQVFDGIQDRSFPNQPGLVSFVSFLERKHPQGFRELALIFEPTGPYSWELINLAAKRGIRCHIIPPKRGHHFRQTLGQRSKTDPIDARMLTAFQVLLKEEDYQVPIHDPARETLQRYLAAYQLVQKARVQFSNQHHALETAGAKGTGLLEEIGEQTERLHQQEERLLEEMIRFVSGEERLCQDYQVLQTIPGVGPLTAIVLLTLELTYPEANAQQMVALVGLDPRERQSGSSLHKPKRISKNGDALARRTFFLASLTAGRLNEPLAAFKQRLVAAGKPKKVAQVAVARKLLRQAHAIYRTKRPFQGTPQKTALADLPQLVGEIEAGDEGRGLDMAYSI